MISGWTWHGGGLAAARERFGKGDWIDLSTGINPHAWPGAGNVAIDWQRLPEEPALRLLEEAAAGHFGVDPALVCALPGTEIGMRLIGENLPPPSHFLTPCYRTHGEMSQAQPLPFDRLSEDEGQTLILANPNNPDGRVLGRAAMLDLLAKRADGSWLVIDEAFADAMPDVSLASAVSDEARLVVFRSFGKFFGLAGVRLGFVCGPKALIDDVRSRLGAWPVSAAAIAIGTAAYRDRAWIAAMRESLPRESRTVDDILAKLGIAAIGGCPLFRLIEVDDAAATFERLARQAILTRPFDEHPRWLRIGLPETARHLARLQDALGDG